MSVRSNSDTVEQQWERPQHGGQPFPGLLLVFSGVSPRFDVLPLAPGPALRQGWVLEVGRGKVGDTEIDDMCVSRQHARVAVEAGEWTVRDLGSRNGTAVDGVLVESGYTGSRPRVIRIGDTLLLPFCDIQPLLGARMTVHDGVVIGPEMAMVRQALRAATRSAGTIFLSGESGTGKELLARAFHAFTAAATGPFVAMNCATIPENLAERLLFGSRRGAYTGASDARGFLQAAHLGTLFLDEIAELSLAVQAKLLRVIETREVVALGDSRGERIDIRTCFATHRDLRAEVAAGRFRSDLYYRVGTPAVTIPPLRERIMEIPWIIEQVLRAEEASAHVSLVEQCLLRPWPGNVRELIASVRAAMLEAQSLGKITVEWRQLGPHAGETIGAAAGPPPSPGPLTDDDVDNAVRTAGGNITKAARALGMHRNQLRRHLAKRGT